MNRNQYFRTDYAHLNAPRTRFEDNFDVNTTFNTGEIIPLQWDEILPGDSLIRDVSYMLRLATPIAPFLNRVFLDIYCFFVPNRLMWTHWVNFQGENDVSAWTQSFSYEVPQVTIDEGLDVGTIGDYLGLPCANNFEYEVSDLPLRGYIMIYNEWFRDENIIDPVLFSKGDTHSSTVSYRSKPFKAAKFHDYFTSLLPDTQKGQMAEIPALGKVVAGENHLDSLVLDTPGAQYGMQWADLQGARPLSDLVSSGNALTGYVNEINSFNRYRLTSTNTTSFNGYAVPSNLWANFAITIESIRSAATIQHVYETLARVGTRYPESLHGIWGVTPADATLQIPEYLGGKRFSLSVSDVVSTADTVDSSGNVGEFLGQVGAYSKNKDSAHLVAKSFTEHGEIFTIAVVRVEQQYFQGVEKKWTRKSYFDFYMPPLNNIGNQPVYKREINVDACMSEGSQDYDLWDEVLGYSEAWADYRYRFSKNTGLLRPNVPRSLSYYNASDIIANDVSLSPDFIQHGTDGINRVIAVTTATEHVKQWLGQFHFNDVWTRRIDAHSIPGVSRI